MHRKPGDRTQQYTTAAHNRSSRGKPPGEVWEQDLSRFLGLVCAVCHPSIDPPSHPQPKLCGYTEPKRNICQHQMSGVNPAKHTLLQGSQETLGARSSTSSPQVTSSNSPTHPILVIHPRCFWTMRTHNDKCIGSQDGNLHRSSTRGNGFPKDHLSRKDRHCWWSDPPLVVPSCPIPNKTRSMHA